MKAVRVHEYGKPPSIDDIPEPHLEAPLDVLIAVDAARSYPLLFVPRCPTVGYAERGAGDPVDPESEAHIARHGVTPEEVEQAVNCRPRYEARGREDSTLLYCATDDGRLLLVVLAEAVDGRWYVATAREMNDTERRAFRRKGR
jgi:hypothetical protein